MSFASTRILRASGIARGSLLSRHARRTQAVIIPAVTVGAPSSPRFQSSTTSSGAASSGGCPHAATAAGRQQPKKDHSTVAPDAAAAAGCPVHAATTEHHPELVEVPSLPVVGSLVRSYSGIPVMGQAYDFWPAMRQKYGDFYSFGLPGLGNADDSHATLYVIQSPTEMLKVVRSEGSYPSGLAQGAWPIKTWQQEAGFESASHADEGFWGTGENWKRIRTFMQTDLLHPTAAKGYVGGMIQAAELASKGVPSAASELNKFIERSAFDMFATITFGVLMDVANPDTPTKDEDMAFVDASKIGLGYSTTISRTMKDIVLVKKLGIETEKFKTMKENLAVSWDIGNRWIDRFMDAREQGTLTDLQKNSYLYRALARYDSGTSGVSLNEAKEMVWGGIFAAVDTTSGKVGWNLVHAALNVDVQEKLHAELAAAVAATGGKLTPEALDRNSVPYLHAFIREAHRLTPVSAIATRKCVGSDEITVHGKKLPRGAAVACDSISLGHDPTIVDEPRSFRPERWLPDAVAARKGTSKEVIDHPFFKDPFSAGPRKCPGSRVALNEVAVMIAQLVLDYKISAPTVSSLDDVKYHQLTVTEPIIPTLDFEARA